MIHYWHELRTGENPPEVVTAVIEIPGGSRNKNEPTFTGCLIDVRPIGVLRMLDKGEPDDKILAVPAHDLHSEEFFDIADIPQHFLKEVEHFFQIYKDLEGKRVEIVGWEKSESAWRVITESMARYTAKHGDRR